MVFGFLRFLFIKSLSWDSIDSVGISFLRKASLRESITGSFIVEQVPSGFLE